MAGLPKGTVTFLLTDIEGSTKLWEQAPEAMAQAMVQHDQLIEECVQQGGTIVRPRGEGDSRFAVFINASDAIASAAVIQRRLVDEQWPTPSPIRVRMALHTGEAELRAEDYYGSVVNRCARLRSLAFGGQTLISAATAQLVSDHLPDGIMLKDLGLHRLKDLDRAEHAYQLVIRGLRDDFPPLRSLDAFPNNLPLQLTSFVGREREFTAVKNLLSRSRLLTLTGSGGSGKTRLALQVAADLLESYADGVWLVELASTTDPSLVLNALANVLDVQPGRDRSLSDVLLDYLNDKQMLIVLDNCEHLLAACAELTDLLLRSCSGLKVLATSREALGLMGETSWRVPSLEVPTIQTIPSVDVLTRCEAVQLFLDRAKAARANFSVTDENARAIAQICHRLDGIPLAIELATTRIRGMSAEQIADRLDDRFRLLTGGSRTALPRQQTLRTMIDWSYDLLSSQEKLLLRRLAVFVGGWTLEGCEAVCADDGLDSIDIMDLLLNLVNKSLVVLEEGKEPRYRMLETIRQYAREKLFDSGEGEALRHRHLMWYVTAMDNLIADPWNSVRPAVLLWLAAEEDNVKAAMEWALVTNLDAALRLASRFAHGLLRVGSHADWRLLVEAALDQEEARRLHQPDIAPISDETRYIALYGLAAIYMYQGEIMLTLPYLEQCEAFWRGNGNHQYLCSVLGMLAGIHSIRGNMEQGAALQQEALQLARKTGDAWALSQMLVGEGIGATYRSDAVEARACFEESLMICRNHAGRLGTGWSLLWYGSFSVKIGELATARNQLEECLSIYHELSDHPFIGQVLSRLAELDLAEGNIESALARYKIIIEIWRKLGNRGAVALILQIQGHFALDKGDLETAKPLFEQSLRIRHEMPEEREIAGPLEGLARYATMQRNWQSAAQLLGAAYAHRGEHGRHLESFDAVAYESTMAAIEQYLSADEFNAEWDKGRAMTTERAVAYAMASTRQLL